MGMIMGTRAWVGNGWLLGALALGLAGCEFHESKTQPATDDDLVTQLKNQSIPFTRVLGDVIGPRCLDCHDSAHHAGGKVFETYAQVRQGWSRIAARALVRRDMPPQTRPAMSRLEIALLQAWDAQGLPEFGTPVEPPPTDPDYASVHSRVLQPRCQGCHGGEKPAGDFSVETEASVRAHLDKIREQVLELQEMPPSDAPQLNDEQRSFLKKWLDLGAP
jgi:uncharacterized membrane protein